MDKQIFEYDDRARLFDFTAILAVAFDRVADAIGAIVTALVNLVVDPIIDAINGFQV